MSFPERKRNGLGVRRERGQEFCWDELIKFEIGHLSSFAREDIGHVS